MNEFVKVAKAADIGAGIMKGYLINDTKVLIANVGGKYYALEDKCSHLGAKLSAGMLLGNIVMCMAHSAQFDVTTGAPLTIEGKGPVRKFEVRVNGEDLEIRL